MDINSILSTLCESPGASAYVCSAGVFLRKGGKVFRKLSDHPPQSRFPKGALELEKIFKELDKNSGACDIAYTWRNNRVVNAVRRVGGDLAVEIRVYPEEPPLVEEMGLEGIISDREADQGGVVLVSGGRGSGRTTAALALCRSLSENRCILTLEDPVTYSIPQPINGIVAQREVGVYGDVPSFMEGLRQSAPLLPDVLYLSEAPDGDCIRKIMELVGGGTLVVCECFGMDPDDAVRRILLRGELDLAADTAMGWRKNFLTNLLMIVFCPARTGGKVHPDIFRDHVLEEIKNRWSSPLE